MKTKNLLLLMMAMPAMAWAKSEVITSPDGNLVVTINDDGGKATYQVSYKQAEFLKTSPLGMITNIGNYTQGLSIQGEAKKEVVKDSYSLRNIKKSQVNYEANKGVVTFTQNGKPAFDVVFQLSNNDIAFRYLIHSKGETRCCVVESEATGFAMPDGTTTFLCPQSKPMGGFARTAPSYETSYTVDQPIGKNGWGEGYSFPCLFKNNDKGWMLISETGVDGAYCASRLMGASTGVYSIGYPQKGEMNGWGSTSAAIALPGYTPWRTISLGTSLAPIVESTVTWDVVKPRYEASQTYKYGRGTWSWIIGMDGSCNFNEQKRYIDFAAAMGYESVLIDALWDTQIGRDKIAELARYGKSKGVGLYLWYNSNGAWNDAPQGPRGIMSSTIERCKEMRWMKSIGILGIKVDFFGGDKQEMMRLYEDILFDANECGILVIFHGCTLPRGWERMYPNYAASEAVLASENLHFGQGSCDNEAFNGCLHTMIRNVVGSMDFGGSALNKRYNSNNKSGTVRKTSDVYALASAVLFQSPVQHFALAPNNLTDAPAWAIDFMKAVPTTWDEIKFIDGYPGKYVVMARRTGDKWYIGALNAQKETLKIKVKLPMLAAGSKVSLYSDTEKLEGSLKEIKINKKQEVTLVVPCNGASLIVK